MGLSSPCSGAVSEEKMEHSFKGTELRLGLPGSESPERKIGNGSFSLFGKELRSDGVKMGFFDDMSVSSKWGLFVDTPEEGDFARIGNTTFLPSKGCNSSSNLNTCSAEKEKKNETAADTSPAASRGQVVGWPPIRSFRKPTNLHQNNNEKSSEISASLTQYIKVSMDEAPYLRKIDLKTFSSYTELSAALQTMFSCFTLGQNGSSGSEYVLTYEDKDGDWMLVGDVPWEMFMSSCNRLRIAKGSAAIGLAPRCKSHN